MENRICPECKTEFEPKSHQHVYCGRECYKKAHSRQHKESEKKRAAKVSMQEFMLEEDFTLEDYCIAAKAMGLSYGEFQTLPKSVRKPQLLIARCDRMYGKHQHRVKRSISATRGNWSDGNEEESQ